MMPYEFQDNDGRWWVWSMTHECYIRSRRKVKETDK